MFTKSSLSAIRALTYLGLLGTTEPISPKFLAERLGESPTYLAKVMRHLVKAGLLRAHRGAGGGVTLNRPPEEITLLAIVEACQGTILGSFCSELVNIRQVCGFHRAAAELHTAIVEVLSEWNLSRLLRKPHPSAKLADKNLRCWLKLPEIEGPKESVVVEAKSGYNNRRQRAKQPRGAKRRRKTADKP